MKNLALVKKYADGLAQALKDDEEYKSVGDEIRAFLELFLSGEDLRQALVSPFVNARKKDAILDEILSRLGHGPEGVTLPHAPSQHTSGWSSCRTSSRRLPEAWSEKQGIVTYEVASAVPLTAAQQDAAGREPRGLREESPSASSSRPIPASSAAWPCERATSSTTRPSRASSPRSKSDSDTT